MILLEPAHWVSRYGNALYAFAMVRVNNTTLAEDLVQETFLSAWKGRETYKGQASEKTWLYTICKNKIIDHFRKQTTTVVELATGEEDIYFDGAAHWKAQTSPVEWGVDYNQPSDKKEFYTILEACKQKLKKIQQMVFVMKYMDDLASEEICELLGLKPSNYWVLIHRTKLHLRSCLEKNWIENR